MSARRVLVLHGPNLNLLPGARSLEAIDAALFARSVALGVELKTVQSNWEGALLDALAAERDWFDAVIVNPAALAPSAVALAEAIKLLARPAIEVQLDDPKKSKSALKDVVQKQISGKGPEGYLEALVALAPAGKKNLGARVVAAAVNETLKSPPRAVSLSRGLAPKSIGREPVVDRNVGRVLPSGEIVKSIGPGNKGRTKVLSRGMAPKSLGARREAAVASGGLSRAVVRQQIADRLSGRLSPSSLAAWARSEWQKLQSGSPMESGQREMLEDVLQQLLLSAASKATDDQLIELMTQLGE